MQSYSGDGVWPITFEKMRTPDEQRGRDHAGLRLRSRTNGLVLGDAETIAEIIRIPEALRVSDPRDVPQVRAGLRCARHQQEAEMPCCWMRYKDPRIPGIIDVIG